MAHLRPPTLLIGDGLSIIESIAVVSFRASRRWFHCLIAKETFIHGMDGGASINFAHVHSSLRLNIPGLVSDANCWADI